MTWCRNPRVLEREVLIFVNKNLALMRKRRSYEVVLALKPFLSENYYFRERNSD
jgi:hypothetical protein